MARAVCRCAGFFDWAFRAGGFEPDRTRGRPDFAGDALNDVLNEQGFLREGLAIDRQIQIELFFVWSLNELPEVALLFGLGLNPFL